MMGDEAIRHPSRGGKGGEWDTIRSIPRGIRRTLTGAKLLTPGGMFPDDAATHVIGPATGLYDTCEAMEWFVKHAMLMIRERRQTNHYARHLKVAKRYGYKTYYAYRTFMAIELGFESIYDMRKHRWAS